MQKPVEKAEVALLAGFCYYGDIINNIKRCFWIRIFKISKKEILNYYSIYSLDDSISMNDVVIPEARENYEDMVKCSGEYYEYHIALEEKRVNQFIKAKILLNNLIEDMTNGKLISQWHRIIHLENNSADQIGQSVFWHRILCELHSSSDTVNKLLIHECRTEEEKSIMFYSALTGIHILKSYLAFVYNREILLKYLNKATIDKAENDSVMKLKRFLCCDYIRHIRNALSHGSFEIFVGGVIFIDKQEKVYATPSILEKLSSWMNLIELQCM